LFCEYTTRGNSIFSEDLQIAIGIGEGEYRKMEFSEINSFYGYANMQRGWKIYLLNDLKIS